MKRIFILLTLLISTQCFSSELDREIDQLLTNLHKHGNKKALYEAYEELYTEVGYKIDKQEMQRVVESTFDLVDALNKSAGRFNSHELVLEKKLGSRLSFRRYVLYYDYMVAIVNLRYYAPRGNWALQSFGISSKYVDKFDENFENTYQILQSIDQ